MGAAASTQENLVVQNKPTDTKNTASSSRKRSYWKTGSKKNLHEEETALVNKVEAGETRDEEENEEWGEESDRKNSTLGNNVEKDIERNSTPEMQRSTKSHQEQTKVIVSPGAGRKIEEEEEEEENAHFKDTTSKILVENFTESLDIEEENAQHLLEIQTILTSSCEEILSEDTCGGSERVEVLHMNEENEQLNMDEDECKTTEEKQVEEFKEAEKLHEKLKEAEKQDEEHKEGEKMKEISYKEKNKVETKLALHSPTGPPMSPLSEGFFSPSSFAGDFDCPILKGKTLVPVGGTTAGDAGYYAESKRSQKWQFWTFDFLHGWSMIADSLSPSKCSSVERFDHKKTKAEATDKFQSDTNRKKNGCADSNLFTLIPLFATGNEEVDTKVRTILTSSSFDLEERDPEGNSYLIRSAEFQKEEVARMLLKKGISTSTKNDFGFAALHYACYSTSASFEMTKLLLDFGTFPDIPDGSGCTALHYAAAEGRIRLVALLLYHKARVDLFDCNGCTPLQYAKDQGCKSCISLLQGAASATSEWKECLDPATNYVYYYNLVSGVTQWDKPGDMAGIESGEKWSKERFQNEILIAMQEDTGSFLFEDPSLELMRRDSSTIPRGPVDIVELAEALFLDEIDGINATDLVLNQVPEVEEEESVEEKLDTEGCNNMFEGDDDMSKLMNELIKENEALKKKFERERRQRKRQQSVIENSKRKKKENGIRASCIFTESSAAFLCLEREKRSIALSRKNGKQTFYSTRGFENISLLSSSDWNSCFQSSFTAINSVLEQLEKKDGGSCLIFLGDTDFKNKPWHLLGKDGSQGLLRRIGQEMFSRQWKIRLSQCEIGQEGTFDLLSSSRKLAPSWNSEQKKFHFGAQIKDALDLETFLDIVERGYEQRDTFSVHHFDELVGCLSHLITTVEVEFLSGAKGKVQLVDLGSFDPHATEKDRLESQIVFMEDSLSSLLSLLKLAYRRKQNDGADLSKLIDSNVFCQIVGEAALQCCPVGIWAVLSPCDVDGRETKAMEKILHLVEKVRQHKEK